ncbi:MAG: hypothetical protein ACLSA6_13555 [Holdemania massiliensis]
MAKAYQNEVNNLLQLYIKNKHPVYVSYGDFCTFIPFWSRAMVVQDAKQIFKHVQKFNNLKLRLKTSQCCWHQPNFKIVDNELEIQVGGRFGIGDTLKLPIMAEPYQQRFLSMELGKLTIHPYKQWWAAELNVKVPEKPQSISTKRMGIDLGIKFLRLPSQKMENPLFRKWTRVRFAAMLLCKTYRTSKKGRLFKN